MEEQRKVERIDILSSLVVAIPEGENKENKTEFESLCGLLGKLSEVLNLDDFSISPGSRYSEDINRWLSNLEWSSFLRMDGSKIIFHNKGLQFCRRHFLKARFTFDKKPEMEKIIQVLGIDLEKVQISFWEERGSTI